MKFGSKKYAYLCSGLVALSAVAQAAPSLLQEQALRDLDAVKNIYASSYAPFEWKKKFSGWVLSEQIDLAKLKVTSQESFSLKEYQRTLREFIYSMKDYHVAVRFFSTEKASLPFAVRGVKGKYYLSFIDRSKLSQDLFPFSVGDELVGFAGKTAAEAVADVRKEVDKNVELTDQALAEMYLTRRSGRSAMVVPRGPVTLEILRNGEETPVSHQLIWEYTPELISNPSDMSRRLVANQTEESPSNVVDLLKRLNPQMVSRHVGLDDKSGSLNPFALGSRKSFVPTLGRKIWESEDSNPFYAYIYQTPDKQLVGYIRVPSYGAGEKESMAFAAIMNRFEATTDALVIDEVNNPGGSVFYLYSLVSMLTDTSFSTPKHRMNVTQADVSDALQLLAELKDIKNDEDARKAMGSTIGGYPVSYQFVEFTRNYAQFLIDEWKAGRRLTLPYHIFGVDRVNPSPFAQYTKPVLVLVNELCFSGGDFFPATLQDNKRVTVMGTRTAAAGGYIRDLTYPNMLGVELLTVTGSIAERADLNPIENLGVTPDIEVSITARDLRTGFSDYGRAVQNAVRDLLK